MDKSILKQQKKISNRLKSEFNLGKAGLTDTFLKSVGDYLIAHNIVKIKVSIAENKKDLEKFANECSKKLEVELIEIKGFTFTLYKE